MLLNNEHINVIPADSLPAIALGMQPKNPDVINQKPRNPNEGIFANGGLAITLGYGAILTIGVILAYFIPAWSQNIHGLANIKNYYENNDAILAQARTMAFTALAFGELFHMLGMSDVNHSFIHVFKDKNWMGVYLKE